MVMICGKLVTLPFLLAEACDEFLTAIYTLSHSQHIYEYLINNVELVEIVCKTDEYALTIQREATHSPQYSVHCLQYYM